VVQGLLLSNDSEKLHSMNLLLYMAPIAICLLLPASFILEGNVAMVVVEKAKEDPWIIGLLFANATMAYLTNLTNFLVTKHTSALTLQVRPLAYLQRMPRARMPCACLGCLRGCLLSWQVTLILYAMHAFCCRCSATPRARWLLWSPCSSSRTLSRLWAHLDSLSPLGASFCMARQRRGQSKLIKVTVHLSTS